MKNINFNFYSLKVIIFIMLFSSCTSQEEIDKKVDQEMAKIENKVAEDAVKEYEIAKKNGSPMDAYNAASAVTAAYLQANDEEKYKKWKKIEEQEAKRAGL